ncbi:MAG TPA: hypothetical protein VGH42_04930 [Verrucomicrobiae bacterium]|jgi:hypothetical protein
MKTSSSLNQTPFIDLMMHPEKLEAALRKAKSENDAFAASRTFGQGEINRATPDASFKNNDDPAIINWARIDNPAAVNVMNRIAQAEDQQDSVAATPAPMAGY